MMKIYTSRVINILLPDNREIVVNCPQLTEEEFDNFIEIIMLQKQAIINNPVWRQEIESEE